MPDISKQVDCNLPTGAEIKALYEAESVINLSGGDVILPTETPATATATGTTGQIAYDASFIYICTATNTWERIAISSW